MEGLVLEGLVASVMSLAVMVELPAVLNVTLKVLIPATRAALAGSVSFGSVVVMPTVWVELATFQKSSTALTVTLKAVPAVWAVGAPVLPLAVPGAAVSPGTNSCSLVKAAAFTVMAELVLADLLPSDTSEEVTVWLPAVLNVTLKLCVPALSAALAGKMALASEEAMPTVSVMLVTRFQLASTALTVTLNAAPAVCAVSAPVLPVALPGEAVSPGARICNLVNAPTFTVMGGLVLAVLVPSVMSVAVTVRLPAVLSVTLKTFVPATNAALAGKVALASLEVMPTL